MYRLAGNRSEGSRSSGTGASMRHGSHGHVGGQLDSVSVLPPAITSSLRCISLIKACSPEDVVCRDDPFRCCPLSSTFEHNQRLWTAANQDLIRSLLCCWFFFRIGGDLCGLSYVAARNSPSHPGLLARRNSHIKSSPLSFLRANYLSLLLR